MARNILITGGTGSLGTALTKHFTNLGWQVTCLSRDPHKQAKLKSLYPNTKFFLADICNADVVYRACLGQDVLVHAAALKDVNTGEFHPSEFSRVNILGTQIVADAWLKTEVAIKNRIALLISSDKAVAALNAYGATKKVAESIFRKYNYRVVRYGNVVTSNGAFTQKWKAAIERGESIRVARPDPTRFYLKMSGAVDLVMDALDTEEAGIYIPHSLEAFSVGEVAKATGLYTTSYNLMPGEKQHESLLAYGEGASEMTNLLSIVRLGRWHITPVRYNSNQAHRMTGKEFLEAINWKL